MILDILFTVGFAITNFLLYPITSQPDVALDNRFSVGIANVWHFVAILNVFSLITLALFVALSFVILVETGIFGYKGIMWLLRKIPILGIK